jgi:hypothetical protein
MQETELVEQRFIPGTPVTVEVQAVGVPIIPLLEALTQVVISVLLEGLYIRLLAESLYNVRFPAAGVAQQVLNTNGYSALHEEVLMQETDEVFSTTFQVIESAVPAVVAVTVQLLPEQRVTLQLEYCHGLLAGSQLSNFSNLKLYA